MRLIDAEKLKNQMIAIARMNGYGPQKVDALRELVNAFCELIDEQPTAFDVEKVTDEILRASCIARPMGWDRKREIIETHTAIEIVEGGEVE